MPVKILMVCLGNICRSPVAEGILRHKAIERNVAVITDSAGTSAFHIGEKPDHRMIRMARTNGYDISDLRARQFTKVDFENFDIIYAMDRSNFRDISAKAKSDEHKAKVHLILNECHPGDDREVPDPYYGEDEDFQQVIDILSPVCDRIINRFGE